MKLGTPIAFAECETSAPALSRGLALLRMLGEESPLSLERISSHLHLPKASVFRLLETLEKIGTIRKTAEKLYEPLWTLQPLENDSIVFRRQIERQMPGLSERTHCSVEWYEAVPEGMKLILQQLPNSELCVKAKPGFLRDWDTEFEAVSRLGQAFYPAASPIQKSTLYKRNGHLETITTDEIRELTAAARADGVTYDSAFNNNGVRRYAAAAIDESTGNFLGVLALAEGFRFTDLPEPSFHLNHLKQTLNEI